MVPPLSRPSPDKLSSWRSLLTASTHLTGRLDAELRAGTGLSLEAYDVLLALSEAPAGCLRMRDLAAACLLSRSTGTRVVDRLETAGLVARSADPADARGRLATITPAGRSRFRRAAAVHLAGIEAHFARHLDEAEAAHLRVLLDRFG